MMKNEEEFFYDVAKANHRFLTEAIGPRSFKSSSRRARHISWLLYSGFMETWMIVSKQ